MLTTKPEDKELLLKDLSARVRYGVKVMDLDGEVFTVKGIDGDFPLVEEYHRFGNSYNTVGYGWKPYLRPMKSMTEDEKKEFLKLADGDDDDFEDIVNYPNVFGLIVSIETFDWLNKHHFDYRGLIEKGLALKAPEEMYIV